MERTARIASEPYVRCSVEIRISNDNPIENGPPLTIGIRTGGSHVQTYATREECRALAAALLAVANEVPEAVPA